MVRCGSLQMVSESIPDLGVGVCLASQSHGIQRGHCVCMERERNGELGGVCDVPHWIG